jgi:hypothetical protein
MSDLDVVTNLEAKNPYASGTRLVAMRTPPIPPAPGGYSGADAEKVFREFAGFGETLWELAQQVLFYWSPARLEQEALRRATDGSGTSIVAEEVTLLVIRFQNWIRLLLNWEHAQSAAESKHRHQALRRSVLLRDAIEKTLDTLERRAMTVEGRALDLRLRVDHEKLRRTLANTDATNELVELIRGAAAPDAEAHRAELAERLAAMDKKLETVALDVDFVADAATDALGRHLTKGAATKAVDAITKATTSVTLKGVLTKLATALGLWPG